MHILWLIGNGFDRNLGLDTDYKSFLSGVYLNNETLKNDAEALRKATGTDPFKDASRHWADSKGLWANQPPASTI